MNEEMLCICVKTALSVRQTSTYELALHLPNVCIISAVVIRRRGRTPSCGPV